MSTDESRSRSRRRRPAGGRRLRTTDDSPGMREALHSLQEATRLMDRCLRRDRLVRDRTRGRRSPRHSRRSRSRRSPRTRRRHLSPTDAQHHRNRPGSRQMAQSSDGAWRVGHSRARSETRGGDRHNALPSSPKTAPRGSALHNTCNFLCDCRENLTETDINDNLAITQIDTLYNELPSTDTLVEITDTTTNNQEPANHVQTNTIFYSSFVTKRHTRSHLVTKLQDICSILWTESKIRLHVAKNRCIESRNLMTLTKNVSIL